MKKQTFQHRKNIYELPYKIMWLEKEIQYKLQEIRKLRNELSNLKKLENPNYKK